MANVSPQQRSPLSRNKLLLIIGLVVVIGASGVIIGLFARAMGTAQSNPITQITSSGYFRAQMQTTVVTVDDPTLTADIRYTEEFDGERDGYLLDMDRKISGIGSGMIDCPLILPVNLTFGVGETASLSCYLYCPIETNNVSISVDIIDHGIHRRLVVSVIGMAESGVSDARSVCPVTEGEWSHIQLIDLRKIFWTTTSPIASDFTVANISYHCDSPIWIDDLRLGWDVVGTTVSWIADTQQAVTGYYLQTAYTVWINGSVIDITRMPFYFSIDSYQSIVNPFNTSYNDIHRLVASVTLNLLAEDIVITPADGGYTLTGTYSSPVVGFPADPLFGERMEYTVSTQYIIIAQTTPESGLEWVTSMQNGDDVSFLITSGGMRNNMEWWGYLIMVGLIVSVLVGVGYKRYANRSVSVPKERCVPPMFKWNADSKSCHYSK